MQVKVHWVDQNYNELRMRQQIIATPQFERMDIKKFHL